MDGASKATRGWLKVALIAAFVLAGFRARRADPFQAVQEKSGGEAARPDFQQEIQPIFQKNCYACHGPNNQASGFRLDLKDRALAGGNNGKAIVPGKAIESPLYARVAGLGGVSRMPMGGQPLDPALVDKIRRWIDGGAYWPDSVGGKPVDVKKHWAFVSPKLSPVPKVKHSAWPKNPIDNFVLSRLESENLSASSPADRVTLLRRLSLDLIGLPPTPEEVDAFLTDKSSQRLREAGRSAAGLATLRRTLGTRVAGRRALRRLRRL